MAERFALRHYRLFSRTPFVEVDGQQLKFRLPGIFGGKRTWCLRARDVAVVIEAENEDESNGDDVDWAFETPILIPYASTSSPNARPNVHLLFVTPQRIPALRVFGAQTIGLPYWESRGENGVLVDGLALRAQRPQELSRELIAAGAEEVRRPEEWLRQHRAVTTDPERVTVAKANTRRDRWVGGVVLAVVVLLNGWRFMTGDGDPGWLGLGAVGLGLLLVFGLPSWARRKAVASVRSREGTRT